jgi:mannose-6-phosphate isomerase
LLSLFPQITNGQTPFLVKMIATEEPLSLQVHPADDYAKRVEKESGKAESWIILETEPSPKQAPCIYIGFNKAKAETFSTPSEFKAAFKAAVEGAFAKGPSLDAHTRKESEDLILPFLNKVSVEPGQVYELPPGTIHSIGAGVRLFEIQQTSDLTYRLWDWNRPDQGKLRSRPLHLEKAWDVLDFSPKDAMDYRSQPIKVGAKGRGRIQEEILLRNKQARFAANKIKLSEKGSELEQKTDGQFFVLTVVKGEISVLAPIRNEKTPSAIKIAQGRTGLVPATVERFTLRAETKTAELIKSYVPC